MIGPSSGMSSETETVRGKRRTFDELDIESFCEEICQSTKKHHSMEINDGEPMDISVPTSSFPLVASIQDPSNAGSVARLEVLVVDGTWDMESFDKSDFIQLESSDIIEPEILNDGQNIVGDLSTVLSYWEVPEEQIKVNCSNNNNNSNNSNNNNNNINNNNNNNNNNSNRNNTSNSSNNFHQTSVNKNNSNFNHNNHLDEEDGNLSWLLDFKLDSLIEAPDDKIITPTKSRQPFNCSDNASMYQSLKKSIADESVQKQSSVPSGLSNTPKYSDRYNGLKKPPFTYTELIEHALQERGELTVSAIYQWISEHFPYYKSNDDRWKNSVRHNLSINPHFRKGSKAPHGAGHLWTIANRAEMRPRPLLTNIPGISGRQSKSLAENDARNNVTIDEVAAATASITQPEVLSPITLEHCAEQILNGIKKEVQVQYLMPIMTVQREDPETGHRSLEFSANKQTGTDFLNPVAKEVVAEECGLIGESYLVTDLNPSALGLNFIEPETITPDHLFGEELSFQFYELTSPSQLQSA